MELRDEAARFFGELQEALCARVEALDGAARFREDRWSYEPEGEPGEGGGSTRVLEDGAVFEKAGVNVSTVGGALSERLAARMQVAPQRFRAAGLSLVLHPASPRVPTVHMNLRYLELSGPRRAGLAPAWFGGGADLTPFYLEPEDATHFHACYRRACDRRDPTYYPRFKRWCDDYFRLRHRGERRGIGGIFFDQLSEDLAGTFRFVQDVGRTFLEAYPPIVERRRAEAFGPRERAWQLARRGRYVEFNLIHDRGTLFGLETGGRTESILMSLPPLVRWGYDERPEPGSREDELLRVLRHPVDWVECPDPP